MQISLLYKNTRKYKYHCGSSLGYLMALFLIKLNFRAQNVIFLSLTVSDGHSGATNAATFSVAVEPLFFFVTSNERQRRCFFAEKAAALQRPILSKYSAATANKLLPRLFRVTFSSHWAMPPLWLTRIV